MALLSHTELTVCLNPAHFLIMKPGRDLFTHEEEDHDNDNNDDDKDSNGTVMIMRHPV